MTMKCYAKHSKYQPTIEEFKCPKCGTGPENGDFYIDTDPTVGSNFECEFMHDEDMIVCLKCNWESTGKKYSSMFIKAKNMVKCPCCKGTGLIEKGSEK